MPFHERRERFASMTANIVSLADSKASGIMCRARSAIGLYADGADNLKVLETLDAISERVSRRDLS